MDAVRRPRCTLAAAISVLREAATQLSFNELSQAPEPPQTRPPCRGLTTELLLLSGVLFSLGSLAAELDAEHDAVDVESLVFLQQIEGLLRSVRDGLRSLTPNLVSHFRQESKMLRSQLTNVVARSSSFRDMVVLLSAPNATSTPATDVTHASDWVKLLLQPRHDREPRSFHLERPYVEGRRIEEPDYSYAAARWPEYAEEHWPALEPGLVQLFSLPRTWNFVQWALEYARETWPARFGLFCADQSPIITFGNHLGNGSIPPLHMAAALGLPSLVESLLCSGARDDQPGPLGTALYCALVGPQVLVAGDSPESWRAILSPDARWKGRHRVVRKLIDAGSDCTWRFRGPDGAPASLAGLAFWFACFANDHSVFQMVFEAGAQLDNDFTALISDVDLVDSAKPYHHTLGVLLTCVVDSFYKDWIDELGSDLWPWEGGHVAFEVACAELKRRRITFVHPLGHNRQLARVNEDMLVNLVRGAIVDGQAQQLRRLALDPRFAPNLYASDHGEIDGTIAHLAAEGDNVEVVDVLFAVGSDFAERDDDERTPLLRVEKPAMLAKLVQLGLPTTDTDFMGRNIWHYGAVSEDLPLLAWLAANDPSKHENLVAVTEEGYTPLEEAMQYNRCLRRGKAVSTSAPHLKPPVQPTSAVLILEAALDVLDADAVCRRAAPFPLIACAVDWGSPVLVQRLHAAGADAGAVDEHGRTALYHLNICATPVLVSLVQSLCPGPFSGTDEDRRSEEHDCEAGLTPAETILTNTSLIKSDKDDWLPSEHNSCRATLSKRAYRLLLTPQTLESRDHLGRGLWSRFCQNVVIRLAMRIGVRDMKELRAQHCKCPRNCTCATSDLGFVRASMLTAIDCLIEKGALTRHEDETGQPAVMSLRAANRHGWAVPLLPFAHRVLERFRKSTLAVGFYPSPEATELLAAARHNGLKGLADLIVECQMAVEPPAVVYRDRTP